MTTERGDLVPADAHVKHVASHRHNGTNHKPDDTHNRNVGSNGRVGQGGDGHVLDETQDGAAITTSLLGHYARLAIDIQRARIAVNNRRKAMERDGLADEWAVLHDDTIRLLEAQEKAINRQLHRLVKQHFMGEWVLSTPGIAERGFALLLGIAGPLDRFANVAKLWKYLGFHVVGGERPRCRKGEQANFAPQGQTLCVLLGEPIIRLGRGPYRELYDSKKAYYQEMRPDWSPLRRHRAARRYAVKMVIKDAWVRWRSH